MTDTSDEKDLIISALRQRIGQLSSNYEYDIALIRAEYTKLNAKYLKLEESCKELLFEKTKEDNNIKSVPSVDELIGTKSDV